MIYAPSHQPYAQPFPTRCVSDNLMWLLQRFLNCDEAHNILYAWCREQRIALSMAAASAEMLMSDCNVESETMDFMLSKSALRMLKVVAANRIDCDYNISVRDSLARQGMITVVDCHLWKLEVTPKGAAYLRESNAH